MSRAPIVSHEVSFDVFAPGTLSLASVDLKQKADDGSYEAELEKLQDRLAALQVENFLAKKQVIVVFEGMDAAGKGGAIRRLTAKMDPRGYRVWPIGAPQDEEVRHHYLWRFWKRLPEDGTLAIFDRSWYGRVLVERVEKFAKPAEWKRAYGEINAFEKTLTDDGVRILKFWLQLDKKTQLKRFEAREADAAKRYKIGPDDWRNRKRWSDYVKAVDQMLDATHRPDAPWCLVPANDKKFARLEVLRRCVKLLSG